MKSERQAITAIVNPGLYKNEKIHSSTCVKRLIWPLPHVFAWGLRLIIANGMRPGNPKNANDWPSASQRTDQEQNAHTPNRAIAAAGDGRWLDGWLYWHVYWAMRMNAEGSGVVVIGIHKHKGRGVQAKAEWGKTMSRAISTL